MGAIWIPLALNGEPWRTGPLGTIRNGGKVIPIMGKDAQLDSYKHAIRESTLDWMGMNGVTHEFLKAFAANKITFYFWRQLAAYETDSGKRHRKHGADATNLLKATEDALQGVLFANDRTNLDVRSVIAEQSGLVEQPWVLICLEQINMLYRLTQEIPIAVLNYMAGQPTLLDTLNSGLTPVEDMF